MRPILRATAAGAALLVGLGVLGACGDDSSDGTATGSSTSSSSSAECTKEALAQALTETNTEGKVEVISFKCQDGWASGADLFGKGTKHEYEAAFLLKDVDGTWTQLDPLPCKDETIPKEILDQSSCSVS